MSDTRIQIRRLERATAARQRCQSKAAHAAARATLAATEQAREEWADVARVYRHTRDEWDAEIRTLRAALTR